MQFTSNRVRSICFQLLLVSGILFACFYLFSNLQDHLAIQRISTGFDFLSQRAGFSISPHFIEFTHASSYMDAFIVGVVNTLLISAVSIVLATIIGVACGIMSVSRNWLLAKVARLYVETIRNIPVLLQIFFWYYAVLRTLPLFDESINFWQVFYLNNRGIFFPQLIFNSSVYIWLAIIASICAIWISSTLLIHKKVNGHRIKKYYALTVSLIALVTLYYMGDVMQHDFEFIQPYAGRFNFIGGWSIMPEFMAIVVALSLYTASYIAEIVRGGIISVDHGQTEAASSLGLLPHHTRKHVIVPQALRTIIPSMTNQYLNLIKNSSLAAAIAFPELVAVFTGVVLNQTGQAIETLVMAMGVYLTISLIISGFMNWYNYRSRLIE